MNPSPRTVILFDPYPRTIKEIFDDPTKARLEAHGEVLWHDGSPASDEYIDRHLPEATVLIGHSPLPKERLDRAPHWKSASSIPPWCSSWPRTRRKMKARSAQNISGRC